MLFLHYFLSSQGRRHDQIHSIDGTFELRKVKSVDQITVTKRNGRHLNFGSLCQEHIILGHRFGDPFLSKGSERITLSLLGCRGFLHHPHKPAGPTCSKAA